MDRGRKMDESDDSDIDLLELLDQGRQWKTSPLSQRASERSVNASRTNSSAQDMPSRQKNKDQHPSRAQTQRPAKKENTQEVSEDEESEEERNQTEDQEEEFPYLFEVAEENRIVVKLILSLEASSAKKLEKLETLVTVKVYKKYMAWLHEQENTSDFVKFLPGHCQKMASNWEKEKDVEILDGLIKREGNENATEAYKRWKTKHGLDVETQKLIGDLKIQKEASQEKPEAPKNVKSRKKPFSFLTDEPNDLVEKIHSIIKGEQATFKKIERIEKELPNKDEFRAWMAKYAVDEHVKEFNLLEKGWDEEHFNKLMLTLTLMKTEKAEKFFDFCRTWILGENKWPEENTMYKAKEQLEEMSHVLAVAKRAESGSQGSDDWMIVKASESRPETYVIDQREYFSNYSQPDQRPSCHLDQDHPKQPTVTGLPAIDVEGFEEAVHGEYEKKSEKREEVEEEENANEEQGELETKREENTLNIVLVGETGTGKTTMINGIANIFKYRSFEKAMKTGPRVCIPTRFTTFIGNDEGKYTVIQPCITHSTGPENNENVNEDSGSVTKDPVTHTFKYKSGNATVTVNLTDTPGMNDTDGDAQDELNIAKITKHLEGLPFIDAICLVLKPNGGRLSLIIRSMLNKLLNNLPKEHYGNIVICFSYGVSPGESLVHFLRKNYKNLNTEANNIFCFDNEPYRYLCIIKQCSEEKDARRTEKCTEIFEHNKNELMRMLERIKSLKPFKINSSNTSRASKIGSSKGQTSSLTISSSRNQARTQQQEVTNLQASIRVQAPSSSKQAGRQEDTSRNETSKVISVVAAPIVAAIPEGRHQIFASLPFEYRRIEKFLYDLIEPLSTAIIWGITEKSDLKISIEERETNLKGLNRQIQFSDYCKDCKGFPHAFSDGGQNMCNYCQHHEEAHSSNLEARVESEQSLVESVEQHKTESTLLGEVLQNLEKEDDDIVNACLAFCFYLSSSYLYYTRTFPYFDKLQKTLNSMYNDQLSGSKYSKASTLWIGLRNFLDDFSTSMKQYNKQKYQADIRIVHEAIKTLANLQNYTQLSQCVSTLLSTIQ